jgi:DNA-binding response OmpR family regulator
MHVLLVEDDPDVRALLRRLLVRRFDCTVTEAANGVEALEALARSGADLVLLDLGLPLLDGVEVLEAIRRDRTYGSLPVVVSTARGDAEVVTQVIELGISDYLVKPFEPDALADRLGRVIRRLRAGAATSRSSGAAAGVGQIVRAPVVLVDGSPGFRRIFAAALAERCQVHAVDNGTAALKLSLQRRPAAVFVGRDLGILTADLLARAVRQHEELRATRLYAVVDPGQAAVPAGFDGGIPRTLVPDQIRREVERVLLEAAAESSDAEPGAPAFERAVAAVTEQVCGMMLSRDVRETRALDSAGAGDTTWATAEIARPGGTPLTVSLEAPAEAARAIAACPGEPTADALPDEAVRAGVARMLALIAERAGRALNEAAGASGETDREAWPGPGDAVLAFASPDRRVAFRLRLSAAAASPPAPAAETASDAPGSADPPLAATGT